MSAARYAIYFAPPADSPFWRFGCAWLGRDPESGARPERPGLPASAAADWSEETLAAVTASPANYGFHATLKPPFRLAAGRTLDELTAAAADFAAEQSPFVCPRVEPAELGRFIAFRLTSGMAPMQGLAEAAVRAFEDFRDPQTEAELAKRRAAGLSDRQEALLQAWGYPYVFEEFRFHMTLTEAIADDGKRARLAAALHDMAAAAGAVGEMAVDGVALYEQPEPGAAFTLLRRLPFGG